MPFSITQRRILTALLAALGAASILAAGVLLIRRPAVAATQQTSVEAALVSATNQERTAHNLPALAWNDDLYRAATEKAQDMFRQQYFDHIAPDGTTPWTFIRHEYNYLEAGENLAIDFTDPLRAIPAWMASPTHRQNMLDADFRDIAIVTMHGTINGAETTVIVQLFGNPDIFE